MSKETTIWTPVEGPRSDTKSEALQWAIASGLFLGLSVVLFVAYW